jgi:hypothetical protein
MSKPTNDQEGVPWVNPEIQRQVKWRDGDIVVSVPMKSGTTWTMNIVHQLRSGGDPDFKDVYEEVPWLELVPGPTVTSDQIVTAIDSMTHDRRRAFKTHAPPGMLPYQTPGSGVDVKYVIVMRNPDEVLASIYPFIKAHSAEWFSLWGMEKEKFIPPDLPSFFVAFGKGLLPPAVFGFLAAWWPMRHESNVLLLHFSDMKLDHEGSVRKIANFLGFIPTAEQWPVILEYTTFTWMKRHEHKFELQHAAHVPILESGAMVRKGKVGTAQEDGVTPEMSSALRKLGAELIHDQHAMDWLYSGGPLP